jgi:23S rRNA pseudouridine955/2504/2580 synthase
LINKFAEKPTIVEIDDERAGQRIDNYLMSLLKGVPRSRIYRLLRKGEVRINKGRIKPDYKIKAGDQVRIPPIRVSSNSEPSDQAPADGLLKKIESAIIYQDDALLVINKPSGIAVHGGSGIQFGVIEGLRVLYPQEKSLELVHRLDRDTSGCLMLARKRSVLKALHEQLRNNEIQKNYIALVKGQWQGGAQSVDVPLLKNILKSGERIVRVDPEGKVAKSIFKPVKRYDIATLVEIELITGRTHQIRVHAAHVGHPVAGDEKYGQRSFNLTMKQRGLNRLFLHAKALHFIHPKTGETMSIVAPMGKELEQVLQTCESHT